MSLYLYSLIPFSSIFSAQDIIVLTILEEINIMKLADYITFLKKYKVGKRLYFFISIW